MKITTSILLFLIFITHSYTQECEVDGIVYSSYNDIKNLLNKNGCNSCHLDNNIESGWSYNTYESMISSGSCVTPVIIHHNAAESGLFAKLIGSEEACGNLDVPHQIPSQDIQQIERWINYGATKNCIPFFEEVQRTLDINGCGSCHGIVGDYWSYDTYENTIGQGFGSNCNGFENVIPGDANGSLLFDKINNDGYLSCGNEMLGINGPMSTEDIGLIRDWINGGTPELSSSLPVDLSSFTVFDSETAVLLEWSTLSEIGSDKFVIEKSATGTTFIPIGEVKAKGNTSLLTEYEYVDENPTLGNNYYRLRMIDIDGSFDFSNIRLVKNTTIEAELTVFPNPAQNGNRLRVRWFSDNSLQDRTILNLVDVNGRSLQRVIIFEGTNFIRLPDLLEGIYYIMVEDFSGGFLLERVVIID